MSSYVVKEYNELFANTLLYTLIWFKMKTLVQKVDIPCTAMFNLSHTSPGL